MDGHEIRLTTHEVQVLRLAALGHGKHQTATMVGSNVRNVKYTWQRIKAKLDLPPGSDAGQMVRRARELGLVD